MAHVRHPHRNVVAERVPGHASDAATIGDDVSPSLGERIKGAVVGGQLQVLVAIPRTVADDNRVIDLGRCGAPELLGIDRHLITRFVRRLDGDGSVPSNFLRGARGHTALLTSVK